MIIVDGNGFFAISALTINPVCLMTTIVLTSYDVILLQLPPVLPFTGFFQLHFCLRNNPSHPSCFRNDVPY